MKKKDEIQLRIDELKNMKFQIEEQLGYENVKTNIDDWLEALTWVISEGKL